MWCHANDVRTFKTLENTGLLREKQNKADKIKGPILAFCLSLEFEMIALELTHGFQF